ncbi:MAG: hypothetical protein ACK47F_06525 [Flavobacteriales bacterium]
MCKSHTTKIWFYQWQYFDGSSWSNVINNTPSGSVYTGGTSTSLNCSSISAAGSYQYRCQITSPGLGCDAIFTNTVTVDVLADPTVTVQPIAGPSICLGGTQVLSLTATGGTPSLTYNWQSNNSGTWVNVANGTPTGAVYTGATTNSLTIAGISVVGSTQYRCQVLATGNGCGTATSTTSTLNVVAAPSISTQPVITQTLCVGGTPTNLQAIASGGTPSLQYQWYSNSANSYTGATLVSGATSATYTPSTAAAGTVYYFCTVTAAGNGCNPINSSISEVIVVPDPAISAQPLLSQTVCTGGTLTSLSVTASGGTPSLTYQWYSSSTNAYAGSPIVGANSASYTPPTASAGTTYNYSIVSAAGNG